MSDTVRKIDTIEKTLNAYITQDRVSRSLNKGWIKSAYPWVYVSPTSFKINGVDVTGTFAPSTRIKYNDGSIDYGTVASSTFSVNTTVNLIPNTSYSIANATLTDCYYSYDNPPDFPARFTWTPTFSGLTTTGSPIYSGLFSVDHKKIKVLIDINANGGTTAATLSGTYVNNLPITVQYPDVSYATNTVGANYGTAIINSLGLFAPAWTAYNGHVYLSGQYWI